MGRPSDLIQEIADTICRRLAEGETLRAICREEDMPSKSTVFRWIEDNPKFRGQYSRALALRYDTWAEQIIEISDDSSHDVVTTGDGREVPNAEVVQRAKLRVDTRKWLMARGAPKKYGDRQAVQMDLRHSYADFSDEELQAEFLKLTSGGIINGAKG